MNVTYDSVIEKRLEYVNSEYSILANYLASSKNIDEMTDEEIDMLVNDMAGIFADRIEIIDSNFKIVIDNYKMNEGMSAVSKDVNKCFNGTNSSYTDKERGAIFVTQAIKDPATNEVKYVLFATDSLSLVERSLSDTRVFAIAIMVILIVLIIAFAIFASYKLVKPLRKIDEVIEGIGSSQNAEKIELKGCTEVQTISSSFNTMLSRINQLEDSRQEFVSNVSHELKTPMTSLKVLADSLLQQEDVPAELYREFMQDMVDEIDRENNIITDLLTLVKIDDASVPLDISKTNINDMLNNTLKIVRPLAQNKNIELLLESFRPIVAEVDETKLSMAVMNLVENAIKYNNNEGFVHVSLNADQTYFYIKIQDNGFGIPKESQDLVFDRFYRVDKARDRATGGTGLGLAITKSIITAHKGTIKLYSEEGEGTTFNMQIPLTFVGE